MTHDRDLIVVGAGMAGMNAADRAVAAGARVAVIERGLVGGTCPTRGCIPTKALIRSAEVAHEARRAEEFGIRTGEVTVDFAAVMKRVRAIIHKGSEGAKRWLTSLDGLELIEGEARLDGPEAVVVDGRRISAPRIILATGSEPGVVPIPGLDETPFLTSDDVLRLTELPRRLLVIGAGPIALELGQALGRLGSRVTMIEALPRLLPQVEPELSAALGEMLAAEGIELVVGSEVTSVESHGGGVRVNATARSWDGDALLVATGRAASVAALGLRSAGVAGDARGIPVDARLRTSAAGVWAAGDVLGPQWGQYTHVARRMGVEVADNALGRDVHEGPREVGPRAIFTDPELVSIGLTEEEARRAGHRVTVGTGRFTGGKARAWGEERGLVKVVADEISGRLLGAHVLAYHGADLIHPVAVAMQCGEGTGDPVRRAFHVHPTLGEVVKAAVEASQPG